MKKRSKDVILFMGTYPPRECGIATFTQDLTAAVDKMLGQRLTTKILAINRNGSNIYNYPKKVIYQISDNDVDDYIQTAKLINRNEKIKMVCIQHEFGIFGGEYGDHLLAFLEILEKPVVVTFHSVLPEPNERLKKAVQALGERVQTIVVMTQTGVDILRKYYGLKNDIKVIPHGIPTVSFETQKREKKQLGYKDRIIISSFGLISSGKGYEKVIESLPKVVKRFPKLLYLIIGETHPVVRKNDGEEYRNYLENKVKELGLQKNVKFYNKYLTLEEIIQYLKASDIYISSSKDPNQITSGTLSYALGCGRSVVSTPFLHAKDAVKEDMGKLVEFEKPSSFTKAILSILSDRKQRKLMENNAYLKTRYMTWPNVAIAYSKTFQEHLKINTHNLPSINTAHLENLTDDFGIIQFARQSTPDLDSGYTLDDNARAMLAAAMHYSHRKEFKTLKLLKTYLDYIKYVQSSDGKLYNEVDKEKRINKSNWSDDAHGRALWALGQLCDSEAIPEDFKQEAEKILLKAAPISLNITSPRAIAFSIIGLCHYNKTRRVSKITHEIKKLSDYLVSLYYAHSNKEWGWFERYLTYANSKLPEALFYAYQETNKKKYLEIAEKSLDFLMSKTFENEIFVPIGHRGWYQEKGERAYFDQQPIEAAYMVQTLLAAHKATGNQQYKNKSLEAFNWFMGKNSLNQIVYSETTGGCYDGLGESTININQGAESTISYLLARLSLVQ